MKKITREEFKQVNLHILDKVHDYCVNNNIKYSLAYGTLLGAIRHKGFIPWDDDIDILMPRPDYDRFIAGFNAVNNRYSVASFETDKHFHYLLAKVVDNSTFLDDLGYCKYGVAIDLFPIDKVSDDDAKMHQKKLSGYWDLFCVKGMKWDSNRKLYKNILLYILRFFAFFMPYYFLHSFQNRLAVKYRNLEDNYQLASSVAIYGIKEIMSKDIFNEVVLMPFEGGSYYCLKEYDRYLSQLYGDYMQLPPAEKRVSHHDFKAYWK